MTDIQSQIDRLPTARRGDELVYLVTREELAAIIGDAQASEGAVMRDSIQRTYFPPGSRPLGPSVQVHLDAPAGLSNTVIDEIHNASVRRNRWR